MAVDTPTRRYSVVNFGSPWLAVAPVPRGGFDGGGRFHLMGLYSAIQTRYWKGGVAGNVWSNASNWKGNVTGTTAGSVPDLNTVIYFGALGAVGCVLDTTGYCAAMATLPTYNQIINLSTYDLTVVGGVTLSGGIVQRGSGDWTVGGNFNHARGTLSFNLAGPATLDIGGDLTVAGSLTYWLPTQLGGHTINVAGKPTFTGNVGALLLLNATSTWYLNAGEEGDASYVNVAYSDASGGTQIDASDGTNTDSDNNTNWLFEVVTDQTLNIPAIIRRPTSEPLAPLRRTSSTAATPLRRTSSADSIIRRPN